MPFINPFDEIKYHQFQSEMYKLHMLNHIIFPLSMDIVGKQRDGRQPVPQPILESC